MKQFLNNKEKLEKVNNMLKEKTDKDRIADLIADIESTLEDITATENKLKTILLKLCDIWDRDTSPGCK